MREKVARSVHCPYASKESSTRSVGNFVSGDSLMIFIDIDKP